jgi:hypothetical protein
MELTQILALYDQDQRRDVQLYGMRREETPHVVRYLALNRPRGWIHYSRLDAENADDVIRAEIAYFEQLGYDLEWIVLDHDQPPDLKERLVAHGLTRDDDVGAIMVLDLVDDFPPSLQQPAPLDIRTVTDPANIYEALGVLEQVWNEDMSKLARVIADEMEHNGANLSIYVVHMDGKPVSAAWVRFFEGSRFALLYGGSTLPAYRKAGAYTSLLAVRAQEARRRGVRFLAIDAVPMSRAIVAKHGFRLLAHSHEFELPAPRSGN